MDEERSILDQGRFALPPAESLSLLWAQVRWAGVTFLGLISFSFLSFVGYGPVGNLLEHPLLVAAPVAAGMVAATPRPYHRTFDRFAMVVAATWFFSSFLPVFSPFTAASMMAGLLVGRNGLGRLEAMLTGGIFAALFQWIGGHMEMAQHPMTGWMLMGLLAISAPMSLVPAALQFLPLSRAPNPSRVASTLQPPYRQPCNRAWQLDQELDRSAPDRPMREGLGEVGLWIYRLAQTLQTLDQDIARINPEEITARRDALLAEAASGDDTFIRDRHQGTARHLDRLLDHRVSLVRERARTASLQEYALAYLEEARAGIAVARILPGERTPEQLGVVLEKLRNHAAEGGARRQAARELDVARV